MLPYRVVREKSILMGPLGRGIKDGYKKKTGEEQQNLPETEA
jgi:hypothetical protein